MSPGPVVLDAQHALRVEDISVRFGGVIALDELSFTADEGEICGLIGPNGAGKTTMFNVVSGIYRPHRGRVIYRGEDLLDVPAHGIASKGVARTFQNLALFPSMTVLDNVVTGAHASGSVGFARAVLRLGAGREQRRLRERAGDLLERLGLDHLAFEQAAGLPFGTLKRLEIARALAAEPSLLLLDEPASGLTHGEVDELGETIRQIRSEFGLTVLLVEHHMALVMGVSDSVVAMASGTLITQGTPEEVRNHPDVITAYLGTPV